MSDTSEPIDAEIVPDPKPPAPAPTPAPPLAPVPAPVPAPAPDYDEHGVPSFDYVRNKIEGRNWTSAGAKELADETIEGRTIEQQEAERDRAAKAKLDEIRKSLGH